MEGKKMNRFLVIVMVLVFVSGCATAKHAQLPDQQVVETNCVTADYQDDGGVSIKVKCPGRIIHVVTRLRPETNYAILIGNDPIVIVKPSSEGIIVFVNQFGEDVELIPEIPDEELKKIKTNLPSHKATADKPAYAPGASADKGGE